MKALRSIGKAMLGKERARKIREKVHELMARRPWEERKARLKKAEHSIREAKRIREALKKNVDHFIITYDAGHSSPTYGDFIYVVLVARYFQAWGKKVSLSFVKLDQGNEWAPLTNDQAEQLTSEKIKVAKALLHASTSEVLSFSHHDFLRYQQTHVESFVVFKDDVDLRFPLYKHSFNLLNQLLFDVASAIRDKTLFAFDELASFIEPHLLPKRPYVAWHLRYAQHWGEAQNTSVEEFRAIYARLKEVFPEKDILVISDLSGRDHFKARAQEEGFSLLFSKDFSPTFLSDAALILKSDFYFQLKGGGIGLFALYSHVPYTFSCFLVNEFKWSSQKLLSYQFPNQIFLDLKRSRKIANIPFRV